MKKVLLMMTSAYFAFSSTFAFDQDLNNLRLKDLFSQGYQIQMVAQKNIFFAKGQKIQFTAHLDTARASGVGCGIELIPEATEQTSRRILSQRLFFLTDFSNENSKNESFSVLDYNNNVVRFWLDNRDDYTWIDNVNDLNKYCPAFKFEVIEKENRDA